MRRYSSDQEVYPPHLLAQKLNNRAANCIENGKYDEAVGSLVKALRMTEDPRLDFSEYQTSSSTSEPQNLTCQCRYCSLDYCMTHSQPTTSTSHYQQSYPCSSSQSYDYYNDYDMDYSNSGGASASSSADGGYVYRQPIRVSPQTMEEGHCMGVVLPLILTFNLALAHHLDAIESSVNEEVDRSKLQRVLRLYELAYRWQVEEQDIQSDSLRFTMVIANNLGEIHRIVANHEKHQKCLEHLLSTLMFLVDCRDVDGNFMDMDGFLRNTAELILHDRCAGAA